MAGIFYKEVVDAIARTTPPDSDLLVLKDLCSAVDASDKRTTSTLTRSLVERSGTDTRLHDISYELYDALMARMLVEGWFDEFDLAGFVALDLLLDHEQIGYAHSPECGWPRAGYRCLTRIVRRRARRHRILDRGDEFAERRVCDRDTELLGR